MASDPTAGPWDEMGLTKALGVESAVFIVHTGSKTAEKSPNITFVKGSGYMAGSVADMTGRRAVDEAT